MKITAKNNTTLLNLIKETFPEISTSRAKKIIIYGSFSYRGAIVKSPETIIAKDQIVEYKKYSGGRRISREKTDVPILYEDMYIIAVLKPAGVNMDASPNEKTKSLFTLTKSYLRRKWGVHQNIFIVHSLEKSEAGVCIFARDKKAQELLKKNFALSKREYHALVFDKPKFKSGKINLWLKRAEKKAITQEEPNAEGAVQCLIDYSTVNSFEGYTHLFLTTNTLFPFQERFALCNMGCPVIGDYYFKPKQACENWLKFYCTSIFLQHPITGKHLKIETQLPQTFERANLPQKKSWETEE